MDHTFETPNPPDLSIEIGSGHVEIMAGETNGRTLVTVTGKGAEETTVEQQGNTVAVIGPRARSGFSFSFGSSQLSVRISTPTGSTLSTKLGSADLVATGPLGACALRSGSGDNELEDVGTLEVTCGSGDLLVGAVAGDASLRSGSGDLRLGAVSGDVNSLTGSGATTLGRVDGQVSAKSGSGDVRIDMSGNGAGITTASGDVQIDRLSGGRVDARTASGDITVGVSAGLPAWTDIHTMSGSVHSQLAPLGQPAEGAPFVELRLRAVSGDINVGHLREEHPTGPTATQPAAGEPTTAHSATDEPTTSHPTAAQHTAGEPTNGDPTTAVHTDPTRTF
ncbi:DUF4097 family beta strand repeat-containing protein [Ornithinimicrobium faecis]|uniref:DUF4097 domain-containing protein n=1 Tax=Ornithinimicrobium faecis TaxID=2934158 RepID=A0ABY4YW04_9MICO|nr:MULTISPECIES: DUF4097 family beta strand repeat-containing protein [unclassified Ornithinimicrobium]USQ80777.1 DUF4097 domain-containing protein [Ornithinimicrobium sp. HY1793]